MPLVSVSFKVIPQFCPYASCAAHKNHVIRGMSARAFYELSCFSIHGPGKEVRWSLALRLTLEFQKLFGRHCISKLPKDFFVLLLVCKDHITHRLIRLSKRCHESPFHVHSSRYTGTPPRRYF